MSTVYFSDLQTRALNEYYQPTHTPNVFHRHQADPISSRFVLCPRHASVDPFDLSIVSGAYIYLESSYIVKLHTTAVTINIIELSII
jgi:hypothetical protein